MPFKPIDAFAILFFSQENGRAIVLFGLIPIRAIVI